MSFGASPGDFITAGQLALRVYRAIKGAAGEFVEAEREVTTVSIVVKDLEDQAASPDSLLNRIGTEKQPELKVIIDGIIVALRELEGLATNYTSLSTTKKNNWDRLRMATKSIKEIRARLTLHVTAAQAILDGFAGRSLVRIETQNEQSQEALTRIEQVLAEIVKEVKQGSREPSTTSGEAWNIWTELRRDLQQHGLSVDLVHQHKDEIRSYLEDLIRQADLENHIETVDDEEDVDMDMATASSDDDELSGSAAVELGNPECLVGPRNAEPGGVAAQTASSNTDVAGILRRILDRDRQFRPDESEKIMANLKKLELI